MQAGQLYERGDLWSGMGSLSLFIAAVTVMLLARADLLDYYHNVWEPSIYTNKIRKQTKRFMRERRKEQDGRQERQEQG